MDYGHQKNCFPNAGGAGSFLFRGLGNIVKVLSVQGGFVTVMMVFWSDIWAVENNGGQLHI